jgi:hypothetical protein
VILNIALGVINIQLMLIAIQIYLKVRIINSDGLLDGNEEYTDNDILTNWPDVYHIPSASGFEWECGFCGTHWVERNSPINAECYTHIDLYAESEE